LNPRPSAPSAYRLCGYVGLLMASVIAISVSAVDGGSPAAEAVIVAVSIAVFFLVAQVERALRGHETLVYYHHAIPVLTVAALLAAALGASPLRQLDATALGLGAFLGCGRVGCFLSGCCYGRPWRSGAHYHGTVPPPAYLAGKRLVPVQLIEAGIVFVLVALGIAVAGGRAGGAFGLFVVGYAVARFWLEELRGDPVRPYWLGLSEAQWTSLAIAAGAAAAAALDILPFAPASLVAASALLLGAVVVVALRRRGRDLLAPAHVRELMLAVQPRAPGLGGQPRAPALAGPRASARPIVMRTQRGLLLSAGLVDGAFTYTLSRPHAPLTAQDAAELGSVIASLRHPADEAVMMPGAAGAFHLVFETGRARSTPI
jgi:hypothetical protein